jgi:glycosyl transferase family 25
MQSNSMIPIFVISLTRSQDRRAAVERQMKRLGLSFAFWDAVDGKALGGEALAAVDFELAEKMCGNALSLGEVGCALSHISLYEMMTEQSLERVIVLEDDIHLHMHFRRIVEEAIAVSSADILFLHHGKAKRWPWYRPLPEGYRLARYCRPSRRSARSIISTAGYVLTLNGARKLLNHAYPVRMPADYLTGLLQLTGLSAAGIEPCCLDVDQFATTIDDRAYGHHLNRPVVDDTDS